MTFLECATSGCGECRDVVKEAHGLGHSGIRLHVPAEHPRRRLVRFFGPEGTEAFFCHAVDYRDAREHRADTLARVAAARARAEAQS